MKLHVYVILFVLLSCSAFAVNITSNIEAVWQFSNSTGYNDSLGRHSLSMHGTPNFISGKNGNAVNMSGNGQHFMLNEKLEGYTTAFTTNIWFYAKAVGGADYFYEFGTADAGAQYLTAGWFSTDVWYIWYPTGILPAAPFAGADLNLSVDRWYMMTLMWNSTGTYMYINGTLFTQQLGTGTQLWSSAQDQGIGGMTQSVPDTRDWYGMLDELYLWNRSLNTSEIALLWNNGNGTFYPTFTNASGGGGTPAVNLTIVDIILKNTSYTTLTSIPAGMLFFIYANATFNNSFDSNLTCYYNATNIWEQFPFFGNNVSFVDSYSANFTTYGNTSAVNDSFKFRICKETATSLTALIYVNGSFQKSISAVIPVCSDGFHEEIFNSNASKYVSMGLRVNCSGCNPVQKLRMVSFGRNTTSLLSRKYSAEQEDIDANVSSGLYEDDDYGTHFFSDTGNYSIVVYCNKTTYNGSLQKNYTVTPVNVQGTFSEITSDSTTYSFVNGTLVESGSLYTILGECFGGIALVSSQVNLSYNNGTLISSQTGESLNISGTYLGSDGVYNATLYCQGVNSTVTVRSWFNLTDTTVPFFYFIFPLEDNSSTALLNYPVNIDFIASDVNLYKVNVTCSNFLGVNVALKDIVVYPTNPYELITPTSALTVAGNVTCRTCAYDSHTKQSISDIPFVAFNNTVVFTYKDTVLKLIYTDYDFKDSLTVAKAKDRYVFTPKSKLATPTMLNYDVECSEKLYLVNNSVFPGHMICGELWIDFAMDNLNKSDYTMTPLVGERYKVALKNVDKATSLSTNSVGIINSKCVDSRFVVALSSATGSDTMSSAALIFIGIVVIWAILVGLGLMFPIFCFVAALLGIGYAIINPLGFPILLNGVIIFVNIMVGALTLRYVTK